MKVVKYLPLILLFVLAGCRNKPRIKYSMPPANYFVLEEVDSLPDSLKIRFPDWIEPGLTCFGVAKIIDATGEYNSLDFPIPLKIVSFHLNGVKCRVTDNVYPYETFGCTRIGVKKGELYMETDGQLYRTKRDVLIAIKGNTRARKEIEMN